MRNNKLINEITTLNSMHTIAETYEEIAATRMRKVKKFVLQNRAFLSGLNDIFQRVEHTYSDDIHKLRLNPKNILHTNGKTISVLLSSNTGLYGDIIKKTFDLFIKENIDSSNDLMVIGKMGKKMCEDSYPNTTFIYGDLPDGIQDTNDIKRIFDSLSLYRNIIVYHGLFKDILLQTATKSLLARDILETEKSENEIPIQCIFEPTIERIVSFFESQILTSLLEQAVYESNLSKYASRMISLDLATANIESKVSVAKFKEKKFNHSVANRKQLSLLTSISLWS